MPVSRGLKTSQFDYDLKNGCNNLNINVCPSQSSTENSVGDFINILKYILAVIEDNKDLFSWKVRNFCGQLVLQPYSFSPSLFSDQK